ncbi:M48 family metalloprotease [Parablastomonas sp. CN1-191]|uniref:M48 family metalloprotease n=1 Tax=Parablastomonas sp. CN1-191 TaxID=3400908 RepID=UPI003BF920C0
MTANRAFFAYSDATMSPIPADRCIYVTESSGRLRRAVRRAVAGAGLAVAIFLPAALAAAESPQPVATMDAAMETLRAQDAELARAAWRLTTANAPLCDALMPGTGLVLHAESQYARSSLPSARRVFGFPAPLAAEWVVPDSPAARAGLKPGDGIAALNGTPVAASGTGPTSLRDETEGALTLLPPLAALDVTYRRAGQDASARIEPVAACRARFEVVAGKDWLARSNGELIQVAAGLVAQMSDDEVAVIVAHELAHIVLHHRRRLAAAGVSKGVFAEFGKNGRLNRQAEDEADRLSVVLLRNAGYDPAIGPRFFRDHSSRFGGILRSRTHASPESRARMMEAELATIPAAAGPAWIPPLVAARDAPMR